MADYHAQPTTSNACPLDANAQWYSEVARSRICCAQKHEACKLDGVVIVGCNCIQPRTNFDVYLKKFEHLVAIIFGMPIAMELSCQEYNTAA